MKLKQLLEMQTALQEIGAMRFDKSDTAWAVAKAKHKAAADMKVFEEERAKLLKEFAREQKDGTWLFVDAEGAPDLTSRDKFAEAVKALAEVELDWEFPKIARTELKNPTPDCMVGLMDFLTE